MLVDGSGNLRPEFTEDGLHLIPRGYVAIAARVRSELADMKRPGMKQPDMNGADSKGADRAAP